MQIRVDDGIGLRQLPPRQVVVSHQNLDPLGLSRCDPGNRGHPVIHRHDQLGTALLGLFNHFRAQAIAVIKPVRYQVIDIAAAQHSQRQDRQRRTGRPVGIEVTDNDDPAVIRQCRDQQPDRRLDAIELVKTQQPPGTSLKVRVTGQPATGINTFQQWVDSI